MSVYKLSELNEPFWLGFKEAYLTDKTAVVDESSIITSDTRWYLEAYGDFPWDETSSYRYYEVYYYGENMLDLENGIINYVVAYMDNGGKYTVEWNSPLKIFDGRYTEWEIGQIVLEGNDTIIGTRYDDIFHSLLGDDYIDAGAGNDYVDGGSGTDNVAFSGPSSSFKVTSIGSNITVEDLRSGSPDGTDVLTNIEEIQFTDRTISTEVALSELGSITSTSESSVIDLVTGMDDVSGVIFRLYNAAFARLPDSGGLSNWINANEGGGFSYEQTANEFVNSQESINRYGSNQSNTDYITTVYNNVLDRDPDSAGLSHYEGLLGSGEMARAEMMFAFSESPENRILFSEVTGIS